MTGTQLQADSIYVASVGAQTPVGTKALTSAAAVRCGISAYAEHPFMVDRHGEPMVVARAEWLEEELAVKDRVMQLGLAAADEALAPLKGNGRTELIVIVSLSTDNFSEAEQREAIAREFVGRLASLGLNTRYHLVSEGNAAGMQATALACQWIKHNPGAVCLVGGMDSHLAPERLETLDYAGRLHSVNNSWGFTPGEAAGFCLLTSGQAAQALGLEPLAELRAVATAAEDKLLGTDTVCIGKGLSSAFLGAVSPSEPVCYSYCDLNGETYRADEFGFTVCRTAQYFQDAASFTAAAECWGDIGTASVPLQVALATSAWQRGYAKGPVAMAWSSSGHLPLRGAMRLRQCSVKKAP